MNKQELAVEALRALAKIVANDKLVLFEGDWGFGTATLIIDNEHCHDCTKTEGKKYSHAINFGGSGDGYYCKNCDIELMGARNNARHIAYRKIDSLRNEAKAWSDDFRARADEAENELKALRA